MGNIMTSKKRGFTLIELVIVMLIIGILAGVASFYYVKLTNDNKQIVAINNLRALKSAVQLYYFEHNMVYPEKIISDSGLNNGLDLYLDNEFLDALNNTSDPYQFFLNNGLDRIILIVTGPNSFREEIIVTK